MSAIRYDGEIIPLADPAGAYLCTAIRREISRGNTFWVNLSTDAHEDARMLLLGPQIPCDLRSAPIPEAGFRHDLVDLAHRFATSRARTIQFQTFSLDRDQLAQVVAELPYETF